MATQDNVQTFVNSTNTYLYTSAPSVTFARVDASLGKFDLSPPGTIRIYIINPIDTPYNYFRQAFYNNNSQNLTYFQPNQTTNLRDTAILKNLLFLNSGGGTYTDSSGTIELPSKTISFGAGVAGEEFIVNTFIIQDIEDLSDFTYDLWSVDSQINISKELAKNSYIYNFNNLLNTSSTNSLTWNELEKTVNATIYKYYNSKQLTPPVNNDEIEVVLNFVITFKAIVNTDVGVDDPTNNLETNTQVLYQYKIMNWPYKSIEL